MSKREMNDTDSSSVYKKVRKRLFANCYLCPWHGGENVGRRSKHGHKKRNKRRK